MAFKIFYLIDKLAPKNMALFYLWAVMLLTVINGGLYLFFIWLLWE
jgi:hypothetical protein